MPSQFEKYRFTKKTVLSDETFNRIFRDIDLRITALEDIKKDWEHVVRTTTQYALARINEALAPGWEYIQNKKNEVDELVAQIQQKRDSADAIINASRDEILEQIQAARTQAISDIQLNHTQALNNIQTAKTQALNDIQTAKEQAVSQLDLNKLYAMTFFFGGD